MTKTLQVLALNGSLRKASLHQLLLEAAVELAPVGMEITIYAIGDLPIYNQDLEDPLPEVVAKLHDMIDSRDGLILATPEYNGSFSPAIKNAIDWGSRMSIKLAGKPVITMGGSPGALGATKAQEQLRAVCMHLGMYLMPKPTIAVPQFGKKMEKGRLIDEQTRNMIAFQLETFQQWITRFQD